ncbi:hypothetical protein ZWY2020_039333 [Hordeum vulgare]|nr:hypothetical protein ZWY2020_039333 [Hordeum vulgare]
MPPPMTRWLSDTSSAARSTSLLGPLLGLALPPCLPDQLACLPTTSSCSPAASASPPRTSGNTHLPPLLLLLTSQYGGPLRLYVEVACQGPSACVWVFVASGSVHKSPEYIGVTHLLEKLAFKDTVHRSHS